MKFLSFRSAAIGLIAAVSIVTVGNAQLWNWPFASSTADPPRSAATLPMTGSECVPGQTNLSGGRAPQTVCYTQGNLKGNYVTTIASAGSGTLSWSAADNANLYQVTLGGTTVVSNPTGLTTGQTLRLLLIQDSTGSRTATYGSLFKWPAKSTGATTAPTLSTTASTADLFTFVYDGTYLLSTSNQTTGQGLVP